MKFQGPEIAFESEKNSQISSQQMPDGSQAATCHMSITRG